MTDNSVYASIPCWTWAWFISPSYYNGLMGGMVYRVQFTIYLQMKNTGPVFGDKDQT